MNQQHSHDETSTQLQHGHRLRRDPNLDLLRATAILLVVAYHTIYACPNISADIKRFSDIGSAGVDLFFVLSGWLISGLWWREKEKFGAVQPLRFLCRRWLRTLPPYYVALLLAWLAVYVARREPFDKGYLVFIQNYYQEIPFFGVSWSLCIEEQFYLVLPLLLLATARARPIAIAIGIAAFLFAPIGRYFLWEQHHLLKLGYMMTAAFLHCEALIVGVLASATAFYKPQLWKSVQQAARWLALPAILLFLSMGFWTDALRYTIGYTLLAIIWGIVLAAVESRKPAVRVGSKLIFAIAISSYSVYLMHPLALHAVQQIVIDRLHISSALLILPICTAAYIITGAIFYFAIERTSILMRDRFISSRSARAAHSIEGGVV